MEAKERYKVETVSHSGLVALSKSPVAYRGYKAREERSTAGMNLGSAIHCKVLEPNEFNKRYKVSKYEIPSGKNAVFVSTLYSTWAQSGLGSISEEYQEEWVTNAFEKSELKGTPAKAWESFRGDTDSSKKLQKYWDYLEESEGLFQLSPSDLETITACRGSIEHHKKAMELLYGYGLSDTYNELDIVWKHPKFKFKMRSIIDKLIVDSFTKTIMVVDLKTSAKDIHSFSQPYTSYKYYRQLPLYKEAAIWYAENELKLDITEWAVESYIVGVQTTGHNECAVYKPSNMDLIKGSAENLLMLERMEWHFENNEWDYPKEYYEGDGALTLSIDAKDLI